MLLPLALMSAAAACATVLVSLPYSTSLISRVDDEEALVAPTPTQRLGSVRWDFQTYQTAASLAPFRSAFSACGGQAGLQAARCVTDLLKAKSPHGDPRSEFVDADFDPAAALRDHLSGAPGHCTARSAMVAVALLSLGVPARIVQVLPSTGRGHNLIEVWDPEHRWLLFDPHFDSSFLLGDRFLSAVELSRASGGLRWRRPNSEQPDLNAFAGSTISYPEPWLYTRVGARCAWGPFRGCFVQVGPAQFTYGPAQRLAMLGALACAVAGFVSGLVLVRRRAVLWPTSLTAPDVSASK